MEIRETKITPVTKQYDVLVCGGGFAGISAALAAARLGKKVALLEREFMLGGLGTAGLIAIYLPLCDGKGRQVSFGIAEELLRLSVSMGYEEKPQGPRGYFNWVVSDDPSRRTEKDPRFEVQYNPQVCAILMEQALLKAGVKILYGTYAVGVEKQNGRISAVITESKSGREAIAVSTVVDATGDADIVKFAELPNALHGKGNSLASWYAFCDRDGYSLRLLGVCDVPEDETDPNTKTALHTKKPCSGVDAEETSQFVIESHASILNDLKIKRKENEDINIATFATIPQLRMTRRLLGKTVLTDEHPFEYVADSVGMVSDWRRRGPVFEVPFSSLYSEACVNLITAGRCTSVTDEMWDIMRVIPCCAVTGQAAGTAAAMCDDFSALSVDDLQAQLRKDGVILHECEL